jgi:ABC-2 type transport system permease protein
MSEPIHTGRLSTPAAAKVVARRDFTMILFSRSFIFFLLGPLFTMLIGVMAGGIGQSVQTQALRSDLGIAMEARDVDRMVAARQLLEPAVGRSLPEFKVLKRLNPGEEFDPKVALKGQQGNLAAIVTGSPQAPVLTGPKPRIGAWQGMVSLVAAKASGNGPEALPAVALSGVATSKADQRQSRLLTAQAGQIVLLLLTMLLAGMVMSNLVEEKANKVIEILAAAIPMDAVFYGKLFAMLGVSFVGICVWGTAGSLIGYSVGMELKSYAAPAVGWPLFFALGVAYFSMAYLLIGSVFLTIGAMAATVRDVQTLSLPATLLQLIVFFIASYAISRPGSAIELAISIFPFSSPFAMLARAAQDERLWIHGAALAWQVLCVALLVRAGASLFRRRVMKSGPARGGARKWFVRKPEPA